MSKPANHKIFIIAGERSGDLHGGNLISSLVKQQPSLEIRCWGGNRMKAAGAELSVHYKELAFMGFLEVLMNLRKIRGYFKQCMREIDSFQPDAIILIDYPGFNLRIARKVKALGIPVYYYIAPKAWAWNAKRSHKLRQYTQKVFSILPFEVPFFEDYGVNIIYVGNPLWDEIRAYQFDAEFLSLYKGKKIVAVLPGSREQEIAHMIKVLVEMHDQFEDALFLVSAVDNVSQDLYEDVRGLKNVQIIYDRTYEILQLAQGAIVTSGTATLEAALLDAPQVVCYRTSTFTYEIARRLIKIRFISLVNLIADAKVVQELIQDDFSAALVSRELRKIISEQTYQLAIREGYQIVKENLTLQSASDTTAQLLLEDLRAKD